MKDNSFGVTEREHFIYDYVHAENAASGSKVDANANVTSKNVATLEAELYKKETIDLNRTIVARILFDIGGDELADQYYKDIRDHLIYVHDETTLKPYCASISLYPFLFEGSKGLGGTSKAPKNIRSFCGSFVNLMYQIGATFAGAVATVEFLMYFDYFARLTWGDDYLTTHTKEVAQELQGVVYSMNQPASARGYQSLFWNISVFDENYFKSLFGTFVFPNETKPDYASLAKLQEFFLAWFRNERKQELLTFPVVTAAYLVDPEERVPKDQKFIHMIASEMSQGHSFFHYESTSADSLASCCRLRNELADNTFSYTLGAGGVSTGSVQVITINFNRLVQTGRKLKPVLKRVHQYLLAHKMWQKSMERAGMLPAYTAGYISMEKQFLTVGINGMLEAFEYLHGLNFDRIAYGQFLATNLATIKEMNKQALKEYGCRFNTEFVPAENLGVKNAKWDREAGLMVSRDCYNSYFYPVEDPTWNILDKIHIHGEKVAQYLDGGAALHLNLERIPTYEEAKKLIELNCTNGVPYWTTNVLCTVCKDCGHIDPNNYDHCVECGSENVDHGTRVIGYLKLISNFSKERQYEAGRRNYGGIKLDEKEV